MNWCEDCVRGRAKASPHSHSPDHSESKIHVVSGDDVFLKKAKEGHKIVKDLSALVLKHKPKEYCADIPVQQEGVDPHEYAVRQVWVYLGELGYTEPSLNSDQNASITGVH